MNVARQLIEHVIGIVNNHTNFLLQQTFLINYEKKQPGLSCGENRQNIRNMKKAYNHKNR